MNKKNLIAIDYFSVNEHYGFSEFLVRESDCVDDEKRIKIYHRVVETQEESEYADMKGVPVFEPKPLWSSSFKKYMCSDCKFTHQDKTNHFGPTWSWGRYNTCPNCPPYKKYPEYGGVTNWLCIETRDVIYYDVPFSTNIEKHGELFFTEFGKLITWPKQLCRIARQYLDRRIEGGFVPCPVKAHHHVGRTCPICGLED